MNVACTACPAKYAVPDDRVRGKRARITCKHCGTAIIVDGTSLGPTTQPLKPEPGRMIRHTLVELPAPRGAATGAAASAPLRSAPLAAARPPSPSLSGTTSRAVAMAPAPAPGGSKESTHSNSGAWLVALPDGRREPASLARIVDLFTSGTLDDSTYVWREGMPEWKPPRSIPEIARALTVRQSAPMASSAPFVRPREYEEEEATRVAISPVEEALRGAPSSQPLPPSSRGSSLKGSANSGLNAPRESSVASPTPSKAPPRNEPSAPLSSRPGEDIVARARGVATLRKKSSPSAAPPPPPRDPVSAPMPPGRTPRRTLPPGAISIPLAGSDLMKRVPSPSTPPPPHAESVVVPPARPPSPPSRPPIELDGPPRSAAPVAVPLQLSLYEYPPPTSRKGWVMGVAAALLLAAGGAGYATKWKFKLPTTSPRPEATLAVAKPEVLPTPVATASAPSAAEAPSASASSGRTSDPDGSSGVSPPASGVDRRAAVAQPATRSASSRSSRKSVSNEAESIAAAEPAPGEATDKPTPEAGEETDPSVPVEGPPFDRDAAASALGEAASRAQSCAKMGGPTGTASATVTFGTNGQVIGVSVGGDYAGNSVGSCVGKFFRAAKVPAFGGQPVAVSKRFSIE